MAPAVVQAQAAPGATLITFSEFPVGTPISTQYASSGVAFSGSSPFITTDSDNPTSPVLSGTPRFFGSITATFVKPNDPSQPAIADNVSFDAGYFNAVGSTTVTYFDVNGATIATVVNTQLAIEHITAPNAIHGFTIAITGTEPFGFAIDNLAFQVEVPTIQAQNVTPSLSLNPETGEVGTAAAQTARFPLGSTFQIKLQLKQPDGTFQDVPSTFSLGSAQLTGNLDANALFPGEAVFQYTDQVNNAGVFQAVHLGTQELTITPNDTRKPPVKLTISVEMPASLGSTQSQVDALLYPLADATGVPPQMIKGQIAQEANFNPMAWRYEPLNGEVGDFAVSFRPKDLRTQVPYSSLRLPTIGDSLDPGNCGNKYDYTTHVDSRIPDPKCPGLAQGATFSQ